jgi:hypothetical protein
MKPTYIRFIGKIGSDFVLKRVNLELKNKTFKTQVFFLYKGRGIKPYVGIYIYTSALINMQVLEGFKNFEFKLCKYDIIRIQCSVNYEH